ncbi:MAG: aldo/keto reductase [Oscillospiraceae bacterium]
MEYCKLPGTDISVSRLSLGTWNFSGAKVWGEADDKESIRVIQMAVEKGINLIDSAESYGDGRAEEVTGAAVKDRRDKVVLATKVYSNALRYDEVIAHCEASLKRLDTDYIDLYQIHYPNPDIPLSEPYSAFEKLKKDGKIRLFGACNFGPNCLKETESTPLVTNQLPYSLIWRVAEKKVIPATAERGVYVWAFSPLAQGLLTGKFRSIDDVPMGRRENRFYDSKWKQGRHSDCGFETEIFDLVGKLAKLSEESGFSMAAIAMAFLKNNPAVGSILNGARSERQLLQNIECFEAEVPKEVVERAIALSESLKQAEGDNADMWISENGGRIN